MAPACTHICKSCSNELFDGPNTWHLLSGSKHVYNPNGLNVGDAQGVEYASASKPGMKALGGCIVQALFCKCCDRPFGIRAIDAEPGKRQYVGHWFLKPASIRVIVSNRAIEIHATKESAPLPTRDKSNKNGVACKSREQSPYDQCAPFQVSNESLRDLFFAIRTLFDQQNEKLDALTATVSSIQEEMAALKNQIQPNLNTAQATDRLNWPPGHTVAPSVVTAEQGFLNGAYSHNNTLNGPTVPHYGHPWYQPASYVPTAISQNPLVNHTAHSRTRNSGASSDAMLIDGAPGPSHHTVGAGAIPPPASHSGVDRAPNPTAPSQSDPRPDLEFHYESPARFHHQADSTHQSLSPAAERLLTPARPLEVNEKSSLSQSVGRRKRASAPKSFVSKRISLSSSSSQEDPSTDTPIYDNDDPEDDPDFDPDTQVDDIQEEFSQKRNPTVRRRGVSSGRNTLHQSSRRGMERHKNGSARQWTGEQSGRPPPSTGAEVPWWLTMMRDSEGRGRPADAYMYNRSVETDDGRNGEIMALIEKGRRSDLAKSRVLAGYKDSQK